MAMLRLAGMLGLAACASDYGTGPEQDKAADAVRANISLSVAESGSLDFSVDLDNIVETIVPGFSDAAAADAFSAHVVALRTELLNGDRTAAGAMLALARNDLAPGVSNETDVGYVEMVFSNIDAALAR